MQLLVLFLILLNQLYYNHPLNNHQYHFLMIPDDSDYISGGAAIIRLYHTESGNASHDAYIDYAALVDEF